MRVLYVEDEKFLAEAVKHNLEKHDMDVDLATDGEEGLNMALNGIYDCIILDIMLPRLSGTACTISRLSHCNLNRKSEKA